jgi:hypothetical protein
VVDHRPSGGPAATGLLQQPALAASCLKASAPTGPLPAPYTQPLHRARMPPGPPRRWAGPSRRRRAF